MPRNEDYYKRSLELDCLFDRGVDLLRRVVWIVGEINDEMFMFVDASLTELEAAGRSSITIRIKSDGGDVSAARAIVGRMQASPRRIITEGYGSIMSAAVLILAAGNYRRLNRMAAVMHHEMIAQEVSGRLTELDHFVATSKREEELWAKWMSEFTNHRAEYWLDLGKHVDANLTTDQCLLLGVVDEVF